MADDRKKRLLELYEARGDPDTFAEAKRLYEQALAGAEASDPETLIAYGYLLECHGRYALRQAVAQYERAIELDPDADKPHYQHIWAQAALRETEPAIALYSERLARSPTDVREHRFLANAYLAARDYQEATRVVDAGLALAPDDPMLLDVRGDARAATGDPDGALADWRRTVEVDPENLSPVYSSALLLERLGRLEEAAAAWQSIIAWCDSYQAPLTAEWPRRELARLRARAATVEPFDAGAGWPVPAPSPGTAHRAWQPGKAQIAAVGGADRRSAKIASAGMNQSREAHLAERSLHSLEGGHEPWGQALVVSRRGIGVSRLVRRLGRPEQGAPNLGLVLQAADQVTAPTARRSSAPGRGAP